MFTAMFEMADFSIGATTRRAQTINCIWLAIRCTRERYGRV
jgi:hypothetical protein